VAQAAGAIWPGGACTHWKAPPSHGARKLQSFPRAVATSAMRRQFAYFHPSAPREQPRCSDSVGPGSMALLVLKLGA
jgi:hypothetical protein